MIPNNNDMRFEISTKCNYRCIICPHDVLTRKKEIMSFEMFKFFLDKILKEMEQYNTLTFPGMGEPMLDTTLNKKIEFAKKRKKDLSILLLTNGSLLTPEKFKEFENLGVTSVRVSLYGNTSQSHSKVHGVKQNMFNKIKDNLLEISAIKQKTQLLLTYNVVDDQNAHVLEDWINFWKDKVDLLEVWRPHNWVDYKKYRKVQNKKLITCGRPFRGPLQVQVDGTVNMCCFDYDGKLTIGDLRTQSLKEIFSSKLYKRIAKCHKEGNYRGSGLICGHCEQRNADKSDVMIYDSGFDIKKRVNMISTTYSNLKAK